MELTAGETDELGKDAYEILSFLSETKSGPLGNRATDAERFNPDGVSNNIDILKLGLTADLPGFMKRPNHSFQWHYDAATTWNFWREVMRRISP